ncbi:MAG: PP2C family serine/threonine-protein phosphatase [Candidatus Promineifilaceae bacterium]
MSGKANEDSLGVFAWKYESRHKLILGVVADGVGGQIAGEVASRVAVETIQNYFNAIERIDNINNHLEEAIVAANKAVYQASRDNPEYRGMSTTVAMTAIIDDHLFTAHVGDSRIYLYRDGRLRQISIDHTWAQEAIDAGLLTPEQAKKHPNRNVIRRHLGGSMEVEVDHRLALEAGQSPVAARANQGMIIREGDTLLICSDGLTDMINDQAVLESLYNHYFDLQTASDELVDKANQAGGKDNITVVILQAPPKGPPPAAVIAAPAIATAATPAAVTPAAATPAAAHVATPAAPIPVSPQHAVAPPPAKTGGSVRKAALLLIGGAVLIFILVVVVGGILFFGGSGDEAETPEGATTVPVVVPEGATIEPGAPATAAFLTTESGGLGTEDGSSPINTPGLIPTLRATISPSATRTRVIVRPTETPTASPSNTPSSGGGPPRPTNTRPPANTPQPTNPPAPTNTPQSPTNTPAPPTNTPEPPTNTPEPPTSEPTIEPTIEQPTPTKSASELEE